MQILALNPFHAGSHAAFLSGWNRHSQHEFAVMELPGRHWKWRMRHAALTLARRIREQHSINPDVIFTTDMLDLPAFLGLIPPSLAAKPTVVYFHENQFSYPTRNPSSRDLHFAYTNFLSACRSTECWFNSYFHRNRFLEDCGKTLQRLPDFTHLDELKAIRKRSRVLSPGIETPLTTPRGKREHGPLRIAWVGRWEHDKNPEQFFAALKDLQRRGIEFRLRILGESFHRQPEVFELASQQFHPQIEHQGYVADRSSFLAHLRVCDVVVSTALHEFFGLAVLEAMSQGCIPIVPDRLAYPEVIGDLPRSFYDGTTGQLVERLIDVSLAIGKQPSSDSSDSRSVTASDWRRKAIEAAGRYSWKNAAERLDRAAEQLQGREPFADTVSDAT